MTDSLIDELDKFAVELLQGAKATSVEIKDRLAVFREVHAYYFSKSRRAAELVPSQDHGLNAIRSRLEAGIGDGGSATVDNGATGTGLIAQDGSDFWRLSGDSDAAGDPIPLAGRPRRRHRARRNGNAAGVDSVANSSGDLRFASRGADGVAGTLRADE